MDLMLTSFGLSQLSLDAGGDAFYRMPPAVTDKKEGFRMDAAPLLFSERLIVDRETFERLMEAPSPGYENVATVLRALADEGFVRLEDFHEVVVGNLELLDEMLGRDLGEFSSWIRVHSESVRLWKRVVPWLPAAYRRNREVHGLSLPTRAPLRILFSEEHSAYPIEWDVTRGLPRPQGARARAVDTVLRHVKGDDPVSPDLFVSVAGHLAYVNANIVLSRAFGSAFHDWEDFGPFYRDKFLRVGQRGAPGDEQIDAVKQLFGLSFPEFSRWTPKNLVKALKDKRIEDLRRLVEGAAAGEVQFDREFAVRTLEEVLKVERKVDRFKTVLSYVTIPLGLVPGGTVVQKVAEEVVGRAYASKARSEYRWFYLISELGGSEGATL
jgi:hypothetical protein